MEYFECTEQEMSFLRSVDSVLAGVIDKVGPIREPADSRVFTAVVRNIIGQQISIPVYESLWAQLQKRLGADPSPESVVEFGFEGLLELGLTRKKSEYILGIAQGIVDGSIDLESVRGMSDSDAMDYLTSIRGIGPWTAEMVLLFCLRRRDVFSFGDLALIRGLKVMYGLEDVPRPLFENFRRLFSPCGSAASLYIWRVGEGRLDQS